MVTLGGNREWYSCLTDGDELCDVLLLEKCKYCTIHNQHWRLSLVSHSACTISAMPHNWPVCHIQRISCEGQMWHSGRPGGGGGGEGEQGCKGTLFASLG